MSSGDNTVVKYLPRQPKVKGSSPGASVGTERVEEETVSDKAISSIVIEHSPHHPMAEGFGTIAAISTSKEGKDIQILQPVVTAPW